MDVLNIIDKKRLGKKLSYEEIEYVFKGYLDKTVKDYQMSSLLMAICINGMDYDETINLTDIMLKSGIVLDGENINGVQVDKHSTGGVGDKTSLIIGPIMASLGLRMAKLSGRGLGHTGGTIDKLESIPGFKVHLTKKQFIDNVNKVGFVESEQTDEFTPLDREIYSLRSVTATVSSIPLIASSIMSKKLAVGSEYILIDLKVGNGALVKTKKDAMELAKTMIKIGEHYDKEVIPVLTDMSEPLGDNIGNALEILEVIDILKGKKGELRDLCIELSSVLYSKAMKTDINIATKLVTNAIDTKKAYHKFKEFIENQGGNLDELKVANKVIPVKSIKAGTIKNISALKMGELALNLGGGRHKKGDIIDYGVGVVLKKHSGDYVKNGETLCYIYQSDDRDYRDFALDAYNII